MKPSQFSIHVNKFTSLTTVRCACSWRYTCKPGESERAWIAESEYHYAKGCRR